MCCGTVMCYGICGDLKNPSQRSTLLVTDYFGISLPRLQGIIHSNLLMLEEGYLAENSERYPGKILSQGSSFRVSISHLVL